MSEHSDHTAILKEQTQLLREMLKYLRFMGSSQIGSALEKTLANDKLRLVYQLSDGKNTSTVISKLSGISQPRVSELWRQWVNMGLGDAISASGGSRFRRSFDLKAMGISVPEVKEEVSIVEAGVEEKGGEQVDKQ
jgi:hypothetical protein